MYAIRSYYAPLGGAQGGGDWQQFTVGEDVAADERRSRSQGAGQAAGDAMVEEDPAGPKQQEDRSGGNEQGQDGKESARGGAGRRPADRGGRSEVEADRRQRARARNNFV